MGDWLGKWLSWSWLGSICLKYLNILNLYHPLSPPIDMHGEVSLIRRNRPELDVSGGLFLCLPLEACRWSIAWSADFFGISLENCFVLLVSCGATSMGSLPLQKLLVSPMRSIHLLFCVVKSCSKWILRWVSFEDLVFMNLACWTIDYREIYCPMTHAWISGPPNSPFWARTTLPSVVFFAGSAGSKKANLENLTKFPGKDWLWEKAEPGVSKPGKKVEEFGTTIMLNQVPT